MTSWKQSKDKIALKVKNGSSTVKKPEKHVKIEK
jgi:hypothetical protein